MQSLVAYGSSDEEETKSESPVATTVGDRNQVTVDNRFPKAEADRGDPENATSNGIRTSEAADQGPALGPQPSEQLVSDEEASSRDGSPYSRSRRIMQNLTLPPVPHIEIPPSPPGSPDPAVDARVQHFLDLKAKGVHLNETLASKPALRNPSMLSNLMDFVGLSESQQYATSLPPDLQVGGPNGFDNSQYIESLEADMHKRTQKVREGRDKLDFVPQSHAGTKRSRE